MGSTTRNLLRFAVRTMKWARSKYLGELCGLGAVGVDLGVLLCHDALSLLDGLVQHVKQKHRLAITSGDTG